MAEFRGKFCVLIFLCTLLSHATFGCFNPEDSSSSLFQKGDGAERKPKTEGKYLAQSKLLDSTQADIPVKKWANVYNLLRQNGVLMARSLISLASSPDANVSSQCIKSLEAFAEGLKDLRPWAVRMVDSSSRIPSGIIDGTIGHYGEYDMCVEITHVDGPKDGNSIQGKYCPMDIFLDMGNRPKTLNFGTVTMNSTLFAPEGSAFHDFARFSEYFFHLSFRVSVCIPSPCEGSDVQSVMSIVLKDLPLKPIVRPCDVKQPVKMSAVQMGVISVFGFVGVLLVLGTIYDVAILSNDERQALKRTRDEGNLKSALLAFSVRKNMSALLNTGSRSGPLACLDGIRVLTMMWLILGHILIVLPRNATGRLEEGKRSIRNPVFQLVLNGFIGVDTFFLVGGILMVWANFKNMDNNQGKLDIRRFFVHRICRILPPLWGTLGLASLMPHLGSGPMWHDVMDKEINNCGRKWWTVLLGVNSWVKSEDMCLVHTWYVSADLHYCLLSPIILTMLYRWPKLGISLLAGIGISCTTLVAVLTMINNYYPIVMYSQPDLEAVNAMLSNIYFPFYGHMASYCIGMAVGYFIVRHRNINIPLGVETTGWICCLTTMTLLMFIPYEWTNGRLPGTFVGGIYACLHRPAWSAAYGWLIFMCATGRGGILNAFLSWGTWLVFSKLTYCLYLVHFIYLLLRFAIRREKVMFFAHELFSEYCSLMVISVILTVPFYLMFDAPLADLEFFIYPKKRKLSQDAIKMKEDSEKKCLYDNAINKLQCNGTEKNDSNGSLVPPVQRNGSLQDETLRCRKSDTKE